MNSHCCWQSISLYGCRSEDISQAKYVSPWTELIFVWSSSQWTRLKMLRWRRHWCKRQKNGSGCSQVQAYCKKKKNWRKRVAQPYLSHQVDLKKTQSHSYILRSRTKCSLHRPCLLGKSCHFCAPHFIFLTAGKVPLFKKKGIYWDIRTWKIHFW